MCISSLTLCTIAAAIAQGDSSQDRSVAAVFPVDAIPSSMNWDIDRLVSTARIVEGAIAPPERIIPDYPRHGIVPGLEFEKSDVSASDDFLPHVSKADSKGDVSKAIAFDTDLGIVIPAVGGADLDKSLLLAVDDHVSGGELTRSQVSIEGIVLPSYPVLPRNFVFPSEPYIETDDTVSSNSPLTDQFKESLTVTPRMELLRDFLVTQPPLFETPISGAGLTPPAPSPFFPPTSVGPNHDICEMRSLFPPNPRRPRGVQRLDQFCALTSPGDSRRFIADHGANDGNPYGRSLILGAIQVSDDPVQTATSVRLQLETTTQDVSAFEQRQESSLESWASAVERCLTSNPRLFTIDANGDRRPILFDGQQGSIEVNRNGRPVCPR